jgi:hypothetical protein
MATPQSSIPRAVTVRLKKAGWEVEITCNEDQLRQAIDSVLSGLDANSAKLLPGQSRPGPQESASPQTPKTSRGLVLELWQEGWFAGPRGLAEVHEEIARKGFHYDKTAISHALTDLVRESTLTRLGNPRNYSYIQKRPPPSTQPLSPFRPASTSEDEGAVTPVGVVEGADER